MSPNKRKEEIYKQVVSITKLSSNFVCFVSKQVQFNNNHTKTQIVQFFAVLIHLQNKGSLNQTHYTLQNLICITTNHNLIFLHAPTGYF